MQPSPDDEAGPAADARARRREALACLRLLIAVARADDVTGEVELEALRALADELGVKLRPADLAHDLDVAHVAAWVRTPALRERVLRDMALLALSDGHGDPIELALVRFVAERWELPPPRAPGVDWAAVDVPPDLSGQLAQRTKARDEALARLQERLRSRPRKPAWIPPPEGALALVEQEPLGTEEALALLAEPGSPPVLGRVDRRVLFLLGSPFTGCLDAASGCGVLFVAGPALLAVPAFLLQLDAYSLTLALYAATAAATAVGLRLFAGALDARRLREGVFVPAVLQRVTEQLVADEDGQRIRETGTLLYEFAGAARRTKLTASREVHGTVPRLRVGAREWVLVHPDHPERPLSLDTLRQVATVFGPAGSGWAQAAPARCEAGAEELPPAREPSAPAVADASLRSAGRVTVDVQAAQRCPFCLDGVAGVAPAALMTCAACRVVYHRECLAESGGCATTGCRNNRSR